MDHVHSHPRGTQPNDYGDLGHNNHLHSLSTSHNRFIGMYLYLNKYLPKPTNIQVKAINEQDITI